MAFNEYLNEKKKKDLNFWNNEQFPNTHRLSGVSSENIFHNRI